MAFLCPPPGYTVGAAFRAVVFLRLHHPLLSSFCPGLWEQSVCGGKGSSMDQGYLLCDCCYSFKVANKRTNLDRGRACLCDSDLSFVRIILMLHRAGESWERNLTYRPLKRATRIQARVQFGHTSLVLAKGSETTLCSPVRPFLFRR